MVQTVDPEVTQCLRVEDVRAGARLDFVDGLRALAALFVVLCHAYYEPANGYYAARWMSKLGLHYGGLAVDVFIVVSGFCLALPVARRGMELGPARAFFLRRARRILPPYYAALLLAALFTLAVANRPTGTVWDNALPLRWESFVAQLFLVHNWTVPAFPSGYINYPLWTIAVEAQVYLLMPLLVLSLRRLGGAATLAWAVGAGFALFALTGNAWRDSRYWYVGLFACGCVAARASVAGRVPGWWRRAGAALWLAAGAAILLKGRVFYELNAVFLDTLVGAATALLLGATGSDAAARRSPLTRFLSWRPLVAVGLFSYSLYLVHAPILHALWLVLRATLNPAPPVAFALLVASTPLVVLAAYGFFLVFERPFLNARRAGDGLPTRAAVRAAP